MGARKRTRMKPRRRARFRRIIVKPLTGARLKREVNKELAPRYRVACYYFGLDRKLDAKLAKEPPAEEPPGNVVSIAGRDG